ncbi:Conserved oligomeric Golgi complex subunit [Coemansia sp. RSA 1722]|nr:Conserved oligomeric Golgi complex subunit [Coemansia sp. RSA 1722]
MRFARLTARFMQLARKLRTQVPDMVEEAQDSSGRCDWAAAALTLADIERTVASNGGLAGIFVVDNEIKSSVEPRRRRALLAAESMVSNGMQKNSTSDVGSGLIVLANLGALGNVVAKKVRQEASSWATYVSSASLSDTWVDIASLVDQLLARGLQIRTLEKALARRRDVVTRFDVSVDNSAGFLDSVVAQLGDRALAFWWRAAVAVLSARILAAPTRATVTTGFPRLVRAFFPKLEPLVLAHLGGVTTVRELPSNGATQELHEEEEAEAEEPGVLILWDGLLAPLATEYCARAATRMNGSVKRCFGQQILAAPVKKNVIAAVRRISAETQLASADSRLSAAVLRCASDSVDEFMQEINARVARVSATVLPPVFNDGPNELLSVYAGLVNAVQTLCTGLRESDVCIQQLPDPYALVEPLFAAAQIGISEAIDQDDLQTVESAMQWIQSQVIAPIELDLYRRTQMFVKISMQKYVRTTLLIYPMTEEAKLHVVANVARFEFACSQLVSLADTGDAYASLRLLRPLLFMDSKQLCKNIENGDMLKCLPKADLLSFVIYRIVSEVVELADKEMLLPHTVLGWTQVQLREYMLDQVQQEPLLLDNVLDAQRWSLDQLAQKLQEISPEHYDLASCVLKHLAK